MNSLPSLIINTRNNNKRASLAMPAQSNSFVKFSTSNPCSMFDERINCINRMYQQKNDDHHQSRRLLVISKISTNFRPVIPANKYHLYMKRYQGRGYSSNLPSSKQRIMIGVDHKHTIGLMQQQEQTSLSSSPVNHLQPASTTDSSPSIYDNNNHHQKKMISSSRIKLGLRCTCSLDDKQQQLFDEVFSTNEQTTNISERILDECISHLTKDSSNILTILTGHYREVRQLQTTVLSSTLIRLFHFINENQDKDLILRINVQEFLNNKTSGINCLLSSNDYFVTSPTETSQYLANLCSDHRLHPLLITFSLKIRSSNSTYKFFHLLFTHDNDTETTKEQFADVFMSLALAFSLNRHLSKKRTLPTGQPLSSILSEYILNNNEHFLYIFANVKTDKQLKYWTKIQRLLRIKKNRLKMSVDTSSIENRNNEEIWIDGPLCSINPKKEIWIDGPYQPKHRQYSTKTRTSILSPKHSFLTSPKDHEESLSVNFDTESIVSSHCHLPVLPVFKDHSLFPFRSNQTLPRTKPLITESIKSNLKLSTDKLNEDMEMLEKTLETLLIPSPIVPNQSDMIQSLNRIDQLSSLMSNDEKTKRLSRIVSPTRFDRLFTANQLSDNLNYFSSIGTSVPNSPSIKFKTRCSRTQLNSSPNTSYRSLLPPRKLKTLSESNHSTTQNTRPSIFQRLFGLRSVSNPPQRQQPIQIVIESSSPSPLISPLTVTLDSHDDLMPLTTSSTASSASGRASSSGYESMSNTAIEEMIASVPTNETNSLKLRTKPIRKDERSSNNSTLWNSPILRDKSHRQQRISQLKHRQNELKLELARTKTFLLMDKNQNFDHHDSLNSTMNNSPMHIITSSTNEEDELQKEIEHLELRLASAKSQLIFVTYQKNKQFQS